MKKIIFIVLALIAAIRVNAQVFQMDGSEHGLTSDMKTVAAGYAWGSIEGAVDISNAFETQYHTVDCKNNDYNKIIIDGDEILTMGGVQGNDNPKDADGGNPALTLNPPARGAVIKIEANNNGWIYIAAKLSTNKQYMVFEDGVPIGYKIAMECADTRVEDGVLNLEIEGEGEGNIIPEGRQVQWIIREYLKNFEATTAGYGLGVFYFPVTAGSTYMAFSCGSKISWCGVYFSQIEGVGVSLVKENGTTLELVKGESSNPRPDYEVWSLAGDQELFGSDWDITDTKNSMRTNNCVNYYRIKTGVTLEKGTYHFKVAKDHSWDISYPADYAELVIDENATYKITFTFNAETHQLSAVAEKTDGIYYNFITNGKVAEVIQNPNKYKGKVIIPATVMHEGIEYDVKSIGSQAFKDCIGLTSITIPNSVTSIGSYAFQSCSGLTSVTIPNSVTSIGSFAFRNCSGLTSITIPNSVTSIGNSVFRECSGLTSFNVENGNQYYDSRNNCNAIIETASNTLIVGCKNTTIPNSLTSIGGSAFSGCSGLTSITIPNSVTSIGDYAFQNCSGLTSVTIPNSVTSIGSLAFRGCSGLTSINVESGNQHYDSRNNCNAIIETASNTLIVGCKNTTIPNSVTSIGNSAFFGCSGLTSITIPNSVTSIGNSAFSSCSSLTSVTFPNSVTSIGRSTFSSCGGLTSITIPNSVTSIGEYAFFNCSGLTSITSEIEEPFAINENVFSNKNALLKVPYGTKSAYQATEGWKNFENIEEMPYDPSTAPENIVFASDAVKAICVSNWDTNNDGELNMAEAAAVKNLGEVFKGNTTITSFDELQYFTGLTEIAENSFQGCSALNSVIIPNSVTSIGNYAFQSCRGLTSVTIGNSVTSIGIHAFQNCSGLTSVTIPNSVISIGSLAFEYCSGLTSITIPNSVTSIGITAFSSCSSLTSINVESGNQYYDSRNNCNAIIETASNTLIVGCKNTMIPNSVTSIGIAAFSSCSGLTFITIPNSVTSIDNSAFQSCSSLTSITIPNSVTSIGRSAFSGCRDLTSINVESGNQYYDSRNNSNAIIEKASNTLIVGCKNTTIPNSVTFIGDYAFYYCSGLTSVTIPNSVTSICGWAFYGCSDLTSVTIGSSVESIAESAFSGCSGLTSISVESGNQYYDSRNNCNAIIETVSNTLIVGCKNTTIPNSVTSIGNSAFSVCSGLTSVTIPNGVTSIGNYAFQSCRGLTSVTIGNSVTSIGIHAFQNCSGLTSITIPNSVTSIGIFAFQNCSSLTSVTIPNSVTSIGSYAFIGCSSLTSITSEIEEPFAINENVFSNKNALLKVPYGTKSAYQATEGWKNFENIEEMPYDPSTAPENIVFASDAVKAICVANWDTNNDGELNMAEAAAVKNLGEVFKGNTTITSFDELQYFTGLTEIAEKAFYGCWGLTSVTIPNSVTSIGSYAFSSCSNLTSINVESGNQYYDSRNNCNAIIETASNTLIVGCKNTTIPNSVTSIGIETFMNCRGMTSVTIPTSVTSIGNKAFYGCIDLTSIYVESGNQHYDSRNNCNAIIETASNTLIVGCNNTTIPNNVTSIGDYAFNGCWGLKSFTIPISVTSIGSNAFYGCIGLTSVIIPTSVTSIGSYAFQNCSGLTSVNVESGNQYYDSRNNCNAIIETASNTLIVGCENTTIPKSVTSISSSAFQNCRGLTSVTIPNGVTSIGSYAFYGCSDLTSITSEIEEPFAINENVFSNKNALLKVPTGTKSLYEATDGWKSFKNIAEVSSLKRTIHVATAGTLPDLISADEKYKIDELTLTGELNGTDIHFIRDMAGINMDRMKYGDNEFMPGPYAKTNGQLRVLDLSDAIIVEGGRDYYRMLTSDVRASFDYYQYTKQNEISDCMFDSCWKLEELTLPSSVTSISSFAFAGYNGSASPIHVNIKSLKVADGNPNYESPGDCKAIIEKETNTLILGCSHSKTPESVTSIGYRAFFCCGNLTSITIPDGVTSIGEAAFSGCGLTIITIPSSVTSIGNSAFSGCRGLTSITISNGITSIGNYAFQSCNSLESVTIPNSVTSIGEHAFSWCDDLTSINVESGNQHYDSRNNCNAIIETASNTLIVGCKNTTIPTSVTSIGNYAFEHCSGLVSITIPESVTSICDWAFYGCSGLTSVTIPNSVTSIGERAFSGCSGLTSVTIGNSVISIGNFAFSSCNSLTSVIVDIQEPLAINGYTFSNQANATLYVPKGCKAAYEAADYWKEFKEIKEFAKDEEVICVIEDDNTAKVTAANDPTEKDVVIPESVMIGEESLPVTGIGENAFKDNTDLALVCIPETIEEIGENAFAGCSGLTAIYSYSEEPIALGSSKATIRTRSDGDEVSASSVFANVDKESCILYVPKNCGNKYRNAVGWGEFQNIVEMISTKPGDANNDGNVDSQDVDATVGYIMEGKTVNFIFMNADVKTDSKINATDIVEIVNLK